MVALLDIITFGWTARRRKRAKMEAEGARKTLALLKSGLMSTRRRPGETAAMHRARTMQAMKGLRKIVGQQ